MEIFVLLVVLQKVAQKLLLEKKVKCFNCNKELSRSPKQIRSNKSKTFFCNPQCLGQARKIDSGINISRPKHYKKSVPKCLMCNIKISSQSKRCIPCASLHKAGTTYLTFMNLTLGELRASDDSRKELDYVRKWARQLVRKELTEKACQICGYEYKTNVCHVFGIGEFGDNTTIYVVNDFSNLSILCPNHHAELDGGLLKKKDIPRLSDLTSSSVIEYIFQYLLV